MSMTLGKLLVYFFLPAGSLHTHRLGSVLPWMQERKKLIEIFRDRIILYVALRNINNTTAISRQMEEFCQIKYLILFNLASHPKQELLNFKHFEENVKKHMYNEV